MDEINGLPPLASIKILESSEVSLEGAVYPISKLPHSIGRGQGNDIEISDPSISLRHAQFAYYNGIWGIINLTQLATFSVNQIDIPQRSSLKNGDAIRLGNTTFIFRVAPPSVPNTARRSGTAALGTPGLEITSNTGFKKRTYALIDEHVFSIGSHPSNDIVIDDPTIAKFHAQILRDNNNQLIFVYPHQACGKTVNELYYQGQKVEGDKTQRRTLEHGNIYRISDEYGSFITLAYKDATDGEQKALPQLLPIPLGAPILRIGRFPDNEVVLNHPQISGHHAGLKLLSHNTYYIADLGSKNSTFVNGERISHRMHPLKNDDKVRIGPFEFIYTATQLISHDESMGIRIDAQHLKKKANRRTVLINDISIVIQPRHFVALVGGSGTGKSTLLGALSGLRPVKEGAILYNGQNYYNNMSSFSTRLGYVPQEDIIHRALTVTHALYYAARLRLPDDYSRKDIKKRVDEVLDDVDIYKQRKTLVSRLSGGQRKRVSIAMELLANPDVFFLDEPTSGLDAGLDRKMMWLLRRLADRGRTIVLVTHTINNIDSCDYVCFLATGGRLAYFGPPDGARKFFEKTNFAEIYSALEPTDKNKNVPVEAEKRFLVSQDYEDHVARLLRQGPTGQVSQSIKPLKRGNALKQFLILCTRYLELLKNDAGNLFILLLQAPIIGLLLFFLARPDTFNPTSITNCPTRPNPISQNGPVVSDDCQRIVTLLATAQGQAFAAHQGKSPQEIVQAAIAFGSGDDAQKILFIMSFTAVMFGCINGCREIVKELPVYRRERAVNLGIVPYLFSKIAVLGTLCLLQCYILIELVQLSAPFQQGIILPPFQEIYLTMALTSLAGLMMGLLISALVGNSDRAMSLIPVALLPQVIFSGVVFSLDQQQSLQIIGTFFPARWAMAAMGSTVGLHGDKLGTDTFSYWGTLFSTYDNKTATLHLLLCWGALVATCIVLFILICWRLKLKDMRP